MSQVNLLPPEVLQKIKLRRLTVLIGAAGAVVLALLLLVYIGQRVNLASIESQIQAQLATNADLQGQVDELADFTDIQVQLDASDLLVSEALVNEVSWSGQLRDIQLVLPDKMYLTSFAGTSSPVATEAFIGSLTYAGQSEGTLRLARWISRQGSVEGWANPWLGGASETGPFSAVYTFSSTADLTTAAATSRGQGATE